MGSIARPFKWDTSTNPDSLKEMSDNELEYLSYYFRLYYASQLNTGHNGSIVYDSVGTHSGSNYPRVGSIFRTIDSTWNPNADNWHYPSGGVDPLDQRKNMVRNTNPDDYGGSPDDDNATDPGETAFDNTNATRNTYRILMTKRHANSTIDSLPSNSTYNSDGYLVWNGAGKYLQIDNTVADIAHTVLKHSNQQMISGDELGTYRIATSSPGTYWMPNLDWAFIDSITQFHTIPDLPVIETQWMYTGYALYLNVYTAPPGSITDTDYTNALGAPNGTSDRLDAQHSWVEMNLVKNILYPIWIQSSFADLGGYGYPRYTIQTSSSVTSSHEEIRSPAINDTSYTNSSARQQLWQGTYYHDRYGTGLTQATHSWYLKMHWPSASYLRTPG